jgi:enoyl-[acyl-carrier protein] reductase II
MVWISGWRLAAAVSNAGGLGLLGAGSMHPETLIEHIRKMKAATQKPWGVNVPLMYPEIDRLMDILIEEGVKIVFTSAGSPKKFTARLHEAGMKVAHVVSSSKFARKCEEAGVDAVVAEGFEAGGHNGREETTTLTLIPQVRAAPTLPLIAAGGIGSGEAMLAAMALGAEGVQIGTLLALSQESSASEAYKKRCTTLEEGDTMLTLKLISPTRMVKNALYSRILEAEKEGAAVEDLRLIMGKAASKRGIFEGDIENGELEIGQIASFVKEIKSVAEIMATLEQQFAAAQAKVAQL